MAKVAWPLPAEGTPTSAQKRLAQGRVETTGKRVKTTVAQKLKKLADAENAKLQAKKATPNKATPKKATPAKKPMAKKASPKKTTPKKATAKKAKPAKVEEEEEGEDVEGEEYEEDDDEEEDEEGEEGEEEADENDQDSEDVFGDTPEAKAQRAQIKKDTEKAAQAAAKTPEAAEAETAGAKKLQIKKDRILANQLALKTQAEQLQAQIAAGTAGATKYAATEAGQMVRMKDELNGDAANEMPVLNTKKFQGWVAGAIACPERLKLEIQQKYMKELLFLHRDIVELLVKDPKCSLGMEPCRDVVGTTVATLSMLFMWEESGNMAGYKPETEFFKWKAKTSMFRAKTMASFVTMVEGEVSPLLKSMRDRDAQRAEGRAALCTRRAQHEETPQRPSRSSASRPWGFPSTRETAFACWQSCG